MLQLLAVHIEKKLKTEKNKLKFQRGLSFSRKAVNRGLKQANGDVLSFFILSLLLCRSFFVSGGSPGLQDWENEGVGKVGTFNSFYFSRHKKAKKASQRRAAISQLLLPQKKKKKAAFPFKRILDRSSTPQTLRGVTLAPDAPLATASKYKPLY